jgi:hypothetical protein
MSTIRQYFDTDFDHMLRVHIWYPSCDIPCDASLFYDANANSAFLAFYFADATLQPSDFERVLGTLRYGASQVSLRGGIALPAARVFHGSLRVRNEDPFKIEYQLFGDPAWRDLLGIPPSRRVFIYAETSFTEAEIAGLIDAAGKIGHELQFRDAAYANRRTVLEKPLAFISHDSRDKESIARPIALNLQRKICPVWYDEFSLKVGDRLRESIETGLKECQRCILIVSKNFLANDGWTKNEFDSVFTREILERRDVILPVWHGVTAQEVYEYSPTLANRFAINWAEGKDQVVAKLHGAIVAANAA